MDTIVCMIGIDVREYLLYNKNVEIFNKQGVFVR